MKLTKCTGLKVFPDKELAGLLHYDQFQKYNNQPKIIIALSEPVIILHGFTDG